MGDEYDAKKERPRDFSCSFCSYHPQVNRSSLNIAKSARFNDRTRRYECGLGAAHCPMVVTLNYNLELGKRIEELEERTKALEERTKGIKELEEQAKKAFDFIDSLNGEH